MGEIRVLEQFTAEAMAMIESCDTITSHIVMKGDC